MVDYKEVEGRAGALSCRAGGCVCGVVYFVFARRRC